jgi:hypothetical protein
MNQKERIALCSGCFNRKLDYEHVYVCQLTGSVASFQGSCKEYKPDDTVTDTIRVRTEERPMVPLFDPVPPAEKTVTEKKVRKAQKTPQTKSITKKKRPGDLALKKLRRYQSFLYALIGGLLIAAAASVVWVLLAETSGFQGVYFAVGVGVLVGLAVRFFGAGISRLFGVLAALLALAASLLGHYLSQSGFLVEVQSAGIKKGLYFFSTDLIVSTMLEVFVPLDLLFYGLALLLGYLLAIRRIPAKRLDNLENDNYQGAPVFHRVRLPLIIGMILLSAYFAYTQINLGSGEKSVSATRYYDSGEKMAEGEMLKGLETGEWTQWYENGNIKSVGYYTKGLQDSLWQWYDESGVQTGRGMFLQGMENGTWIQYFSNGVVSDSGAYREGKMEGLWKYYYESGNLKYTVHYKDGEMHGERILLSPTGKIAREQYFDQGVEIDN